ACASRAAATLSETSFLMAARVVGGGADVDVLLDSSGTGSLPSGRVDLIGDEDPTDEDGDIGMGVSTGVSMSLGGEISSRGNKSQESKISGRDNTGDGGTIVEGGIVTCGGLMASYSCMTFIQGSL
ncbi:hypothetical protein Tco_0191962, partial [Tanacetum coccineum]